MAIAKFSTNGLTAMREAKALLLYSFKRLSVLEEFMLRYVSTVADFKISIMLTSVGWNVVRNFNANRKFLSEVSPQAANCVSHSSYFAVNSNYVQDFYVSRIKYFFV